MTIIPLVSYNNILEDAKSIYSSAAWGDSEELYKNYDKFFKKASQINPSVARMSLQQAQNDIYTKFAEDFVEERLDEASFNTAKKNIYKTSFELNRSNCLVNLEKRIREMYPKSSRKRLAIVSCLMDGEELGLANVKNAKGMKKFQYFIRKLLRR
jgi:hypothetical protein